MMQFVEFRDICNVTPPFFFQFDCRPPVPPMPMPPPFPPDYPPLPEEEMELSSGEESEYESGDDEDKERCRADG